MPAEASIVQDGVARRYRATHKWQLMRLTRRWGRRPQPGRACRIQVAPGFATEARALLEPLKNPKPLAEQDPEPLRCHARGVRPRPDETMVLTDTYLPEVMAAEGLAASSAAWPQLAARAYRGRTG